VQAPVETKGSNGLAVAGFVLALLGTLTSFIPLVNIFGDFLAVLGLIFGIIGLVKSRAKGAGKGLSIAAIILAVAAFVISISVNVAAAAVVNAIPTTPEALASAGASIAAAAPAPADAASSCSVVKEALLTGTPAEINAAMLALVADKGADQTAREYADYYTNRDKNQKDLQKMDATLIQTACI
jgi:hypothetical protein